MGRMIYGSAREEIRLDDRTLAHLKAVVISKWRRGEKFLFTWSPSPDSGQGPRSLWMHPEIPLRFTFSSGPSPDLNRTWLEHLLRSANSAAGLQLMPEPPQE